VEAEAAAPVLAPEVAAVPVISDIDELESVPELSPDDLIEPEPAAEPVVDETQVPTIEPMPEETIPLVEPEKGDPEPLAFDDDFDLSEFDDLPDAEVEKGAEKGAEKDTDPEPKKTPDNDRKK